MSAPEIFRAATQSILGLLGEDALFAGVARTRINVEYDVQFAGIGGEEAQYRGDLSASRDVATVDLALAPAVGKSFRFVDAAGLPTGPTYVLDKLIDSNGYSSRFIVRKVREP